MTGLRKTVTQITLHLLTLFLGAVLGVGVILWHQEYNPFTGNFRDGPAEQTDIPLPVVSPRPTPLPSAQPS